MDKNDVIKLFNLLETLYGGHKRPRDNATLSVWASVLKLWSYEEVREAAINRAREKRFFPDPSELVEYLPYRRDDSWVLQYISDRMTEAEKRTAEHAARIREIYHAAGLPTASEAKSMGINHAAWCEMVNKAFPDGVPEEEKPCETET